MSMKFDEWSDEFTRLMYHALKDGVSPPLIIAALEFAKIDLVNRQITVAMQMQADKLSKSIIDPKGNITGQG
jgi:hypothetical protein